ncbi:unnamed protein product [Orchesella dallaii]|uniref:Retinol dehydrogenase 12 n=1 Tax=Orchesella dallaii TaxID=48710 RepID=A0ABP1REG2_9HEXA
MASFQHTSRRTSFWKNPLFTFEFAKDFVKFRFHYFNNSQEESVKGKIAIVTGSNSGIGKQLAKDLAERGAIVIIACRNLKAGKEAMEEISRENPSVTLELMELDLGNLSSIRKFASEVKSRYPAVHLLINNAGVSSFKEERQKTSDGFELHMGVNHLGHFLLTNLLLDKLKAGAPSRIVNVSSSTMLVSNLKLDDLMMERVKEPTRFLGISRLPYNNSKMANALFTKELARRLKGTGVNAYTVCPGIVNTNAFRDTSPTENLVVKISIALTGIPVEKASLGVLYCALSKKCGHESGNFYRAGGVCMRANKQITSQDAYERWEKSCKLVGL